MLKGIIRYEKKSYYIYINSLSNIHTFHVLCVNKNHCFSLNESKASDLLREIFQSSQLHFLEEKDGYQIYLDESKNKRYFKDQKEDFFLFFQNNGVSAIMAQGYGRLDDEKQFFIKVGKQTISITLSLLSAIVLNVYLNNLYHSYINHVDYQDVAYYEEVPDITADDVKNYIMNTDDESMALADKVYFCNEDFIRDVLEVADSSRSYSLRKSLKNFGIRYFTNFEIVPKSWFGYYNLGDPNHIHLRDDNFSTFRCAGAHEFVHLMQDINKYRYIEEACAEIMAQEYFGHDAQSYPTERTRVYALMEMIGPEPIMECNFRGDTSSFEEAIHRYLDEEDANQLLELFTAQPGYYDEEERDRVNQEIDVLLAKMYQNIYNKDIKEDKMIAHIYEYRGNLWDRYYFNQNSNYFLDDYYFEGKYEEFPLDYNYVMENNMVSKYVYTNKTRISDEHFNNLTNKDSISMDGRIYIDDNTYVDILYFAAPEYYRENDYFVSTDRKEVYTFEEAIEKGIITADNYILVEKYSYDTLEDLLQAHDDFSYVSVIYTDGSSGFLSKNQDNEYSFSQFLSSTSFTEPSIAKKFPEQVKTNQEVEEDNSISK